MPTSFLARALRGLLRELLGGLGGLLRGVLFVATGMALMAGALFAFGLIGLGIATVVVIAVGLYATFSAYAAEGSDGDD